MLFYLINVDEFIILCSTITLSFLLLKFRVNKMDCCS